jgi:hypothetical protein
MITTIKKLAIGATFYLPQHPGNAYRLLDHKGQAEFIKHRLHNTYVGRRLTMATDQLVATDPSDPVPPSCLCCDRPAIEDDLCQPCLWESRRTDLSLL